MANRKDTREEILITALKLFLKKGIGNVSVNNIITTAGYTQAALYYYFESKDQLIDELMYKCYFGFMSDTLSSIEEDDLDWKGVISKLFQLGMIETEHINWPKKIYEFLKRKYNK